jgi:hypothetical protein
MNEITAIVTVESLPRDGGSLPAEKKLPYTRPQVVVYGSVTELTGGSVGAFIDNVGSTPTHTLSGSPPLGRSATDGIFVRLPLGRVPWRQGTVPLFFSRG